MSAEVTSPPVGFGPDLIMQMGMSFVPARVLTTSLQLDFFLHIANGHHSAAAIAQAAQSSERGTTMLLDVLTSLQLLTKQDGLYHLTPLSAQYLVRTSPKYVGALFEIEHMWQAWSHLTEVVRNGKPEGKVEMQETAEQFFPILIKSLHVLNASPAQQLAQILGAAHPGLHVLDIGCGSGIWSIPFAEQDKTAHLTMQDFPGVLVHTERFLSQHSVREQSDLLPGDLKVVDYGQERFDLALLGNIVHSEGEESSRHLFLKVCQALKPGGRIAVIDMIPNTERTGPPPALMFAVNMLVHTEKGSTYTLNEYTEWLTAAGFSQVETVTLNGFHSPIIVGTK